MSNHGTRVRESTTQRMGDARFGGTRVLVHEQNGSRGTKVTIKEPAEYVETAPGVRVRVPSADTSKGPEEIAAGATKVVPAESRQVGNTKVSAAPSKLSEDELRALRVEAGLDPDTGLPREIDPETADEAKNQP